MMIRGLFVNGRVALILTLGVLALAAHRAPPIAANGAFRIVVHPSNPVSTLSRHELSQMFLKKVTRWPTGTAAVPVDQPGSSVVRDAFSRAVHGRAASAVAAYWQQQIFSGRSIPPVERNGDADVVSFVRDTPGAVGYVSPTAAIGELKVLAVQE